jgi:GT2 family glycosyltransferase
MMPDFNRKSIYIIIPAYNRKATTLACLENLKSTDDLEKYQTIVIDDGSTDGTALAIQSLYSNVIVLEGNGNLWWSGAIKMGMEYAYRQGAEYFIWLNDDCLPDPEALPLLIDYLKSKPNAIAAPSCYMKESGQVVENGFRKRTRLSAIENQVVAVEGVAGYCVAFPRNLIDAIGFPDVYRFPHYAGDDMYILKATRHRFSAVLLGNAKVALTEMKSLTYTFSNYTKDRFTGQLSLALVFFNKKSRYYLPTQFYYHISKYPRLGIVFFFLKSSAWLAQFIYLKIEELYVLDGSIS